MTSQQQFDIAMAHHRAGRLGEAEAIYRGLLTEFPGQTDLLHLLGVLAGQTGHARDAVEWIRGAISANPNDPAYHSNLAVWLVELGQLDDAARAHEAAIGLDPNFADAHFNLGFVRMRQREWDAAAECYRRVIALRGDFADAHLKLGAALANAGRLDETIAVLRAALERLPTHGGLWNNLGNALREREDLDAAADAYRAGLACEPENAALTNNLGNALKDEGRPGEAIECFRRSLALNPSSEVHSNLIFTLHFDPDATPESIAGEQRRWSGQFRDLLRLPHANNRSPERRLRVGYVSPDLCGHPVGRLLLPVFAEHDRGQFEVVAYSEGAADSLTEELRAHAALWRDTGEMGDEQLAAQIRADGIDILVDLALHTAGNRLPVFARKPAPVQVSWLGYASGTGLETIDHRLTDAVLDPPGGDERAVRLPDGWCCYRPHGSPAPVAELPAGRNGHVTFGSFNAFAKTSERVLALWARVLRAVANARLLMVAPPGSARERTRAIFQRHGVAPERIEFLGRSSPEEYFRSYGRIDLALDPFPYSGMTTTCDALWMGVPVVALIGAQPLSRTAFSVLCAAGLPELAAHSEDDFVNIARGLAGELELLAWLRATLRERLRASPLMDAPRFARNLEAAYRGMWRRWCALAP